MIKHFNDNSNKINLLSLFQEEASERKKVEELKEVLEGMQKTCTQLYKEILESSIHSETLKRELIYKESQTLDYEWKIKNLKNQNNLLETQLVETKKIYNNLERQIEEKTIELNQIIVKCEEAKHKEKIMLLGDT